MDNDAMEYRVCGARLTVVPGVSFRAAFAWQVRSLCRSEPGFDAIAVSLGPLVAAASASWLGELLPEPQTALPCMLGLVFANCLVHPARRSELLRYQESTGEDIEDLSPELLTYMLDYSPFNLFCLSPVDSRVEAVRCALERGLPLYGIDLDAYASTKFPEVCMADPAAAFGRVAQYVNGHRFLFPPRSEDEVDRRREYIMAVRLKALCHAHARVLFVCGIEHWNGIAALLEQELPDSPLLRFQERQWDTTRYRRVVVDPTIAIRYMDAFPAVTQGYEMCRSGTPEGFFDIDNSMQSSVIMDRILASVATRYFCTDQFTKNDTARAEDLEALPGFHDQLERYRQITGRSDCSVLVRAAQSMMSGKFTRVLAEKLAEFPWAAPEQFPECGQVTYDSDGCGGAITAKYAPEGANSFVQMSLHPPLYQSYEMKIPLSVGSKGAPPESDDDHSLVASKFTWPPWEYLFSFLCKRAVSHGTMPQKEASIEKYQGDIGQGVDVRATLKAVIRGEKALYVKIPKTVRKRIEPQTGDGFPVVWIFDPASPNGNQWHGLIEYLHGLESYASDPELIPAMMKSKGNRFYAVITCGANKYSLEHIGNYSTECAGLVYFHPGFSPRNLCRWLESTRFGRVPFTQPFSPYDVRAELSRFLEAQGRSGLGVSPWYIDLIRAVLPFCGETLTVVTPPGLKVVNGEIPDDCAFFGKRIKYTSLSALPAHHVQQIRSVDMVEGRYDAATGLVLFCKEATEAMDEPISLYGGLDKDGWDNDDLMQ